MLVPPPTISSSTNNKAAEVHTILGMFFEDMKSGT
jgi:hypothetical protein